MYLHVASTVFTKNYDLAGHWGTAVSPPNHGTSTHTQTHTRACAHVCSTQQAPEALVGVRGTLWCLSCETEILVKNDIFRIS